MSADRPAPGELVVPPLSPRKLTLWHALRGLEPGQQPRPEEQRRPRRRRRRA